MYLLVCTKFHCSVLWYWKPCHSISAYFQNNHVSLVYSDRKLRISSMHIPNTVTSQRSVGVYQYVGVHHQMNLLTIINAKPCMARTVDSVIQILSSVT